MPPIRPDQAESLAAVPLPRFPSTFTTTCDALHVGSSVVLLGDSGHSCLNGLGQGCNVALESCRVFDGVLREHKGNLETALPAFTVRCLLLLCFPCMTASSIGTESDHSRIDMSSVVCSLWRGLCSVSFPRACVRAPV